MPSLANFENTMSEPQAKLKWYYRPWVVLAMLFFVLGPLGLPLVYKSPAFSRTWKIILTVLMIAYTWYLVVETYRFFVFYVDYLENLFGTGAAQ